MNEKELALRTVEVTRSTLERALNDPEVLVAMVVHEVNMEDVELLVKDILKYLDKTKDKLKPAS